jgi:uncharacterized oligopeptide transporter (OPT) family protein
VLAVAVGIYLPLELTTPIMLGGLLAHFAARRNAAEGVAAVAGRNGVLFAAGLITGEALVGILMAVPIVIWSDPDVIALPFALPTVVGLAIVAAVAVALYRAARSSAA